jgi:hypothetical protein
MTVVQQALMQYCNEALSAMVSDVVTVESKTALNKFLERIGTSSAIRKGIQRPGWFQFLNFRDNTHGEAFSTNSLFSHSISRQVLEMS